MAKAKEKYARVRYISEGENGESEGYALEMLVNGEWGLICKTTLRRSADFPDETEKNFIHYTFMNKIIELLDLGYKVHRI